MALRLHVQESKLRLKVVSNTYKLSVSEGVPIYPEPYQGEYSVTPSEVEQVLPMAGLMASQNVTVAPIPSNYGRILYNGSTITVY